MGGRDMIALSSNSIQLVEAEQVIANGGLLAILVIVESSAKVP